MRVIPVNGLRLTILLISFLLVLGGAALAQTSVVRGTALDQQGQPVAGATITLTDDAEELHAEANYIRRGRFCFQCGAAWYLQDGGRSAGVQEGGGKRSKSAHGYACRCRLFPSKSAQSLM